VLDERGLLAVAKAPRDHAHRATGSTWAASANLQFYFIADMKEAQVFIFKHKRDRSIMRSVSKYIELLLTILIFFVLQSHNQNHTARKNNNGS
jgi:hypothetical protein